MKEIKKIKMKRFRDLKVGDICHSITNNNMYTEVRVDSIVDRPNGDRYIVFRATKDNSHCGGYYVRPDQFNDLKVSNFPYCDVYFNAQTAVDILSTEVLYLFDSINQIKRKHNIC